MTVSNSDSEDNWFEAQHDFEAEEKSKTQLKREAEEKQKLATQLVEMSEANLTKMPLDDELLDAVLVARKINRKKDGYRRQLQFLGKLMRSRDTTPIEQAIMLLTNQHRMANAHFHYLETLRDNIITAGDSAIEEVLSEHPQLERQKLRQLQRKINKEQQQNKPPAGARELFKYLKASIEE
ncbi:ribosome biogenesis factor YjgA [Alteromonas sp. ASW11-36]|uniref:Dual-action ribosomal maturation protein DarP n=1 Tax=Alteromonas arenosi TaxID=3055817 RepID=A0ABT7SSF5_9ALTE|nr:ribosome biogenesis factor YjgA [Alteromonas sp. ASW11-36]MDM7859122.1 ribosome biogenesis factor YjgA [Alteromonas sp. ASW11-36]